MNALDSVSMLTPQDWMLKALECAKYAAAEDEVPVGAILVFDNEMIGEGWNRPIAMQDPSAHAEIQAIRQAAKRLGNYRLLNTTLYVTLEPCAMCLGAMIHARIGRLVFGAEDSKAGAVKSVFQLLDSGHLNHKISWESGILAEDCGSILSQFFRSKRQKLGRSSGGND